MLKKFASVFLMTGLMLVPVAGSVAQTHLLVKLSSGNTQSYPINEVRSLRFSNSAMQIHFFASTTISFSTSEVSEYYFGNATRTADMFDGDDLSAAIIPNPAKNQIGVHYKNPGMETVSITMHDATGKLVYQIFEGKHEGAKVYEQTLHVPSGLYFCRISSPEKTISKPVIVE